MCTESQTRAQAENWMRCVISGQISNLHAMFQPEKMAIIPLQEYRQVYQRLEQAVETLEVALECLQKIQLERKIP